MPSGRWLQLRGGGWGAATPELRQEFIDSVPVVMTVNGDHVPLEMVFSTQPFEDPLGNGVKTYVVRWEHLSHPLRPGDYHITTTFGPTAAELHDGLVESPVLPEGTTFVRERDLIVTPRGQFAATSEVACAPTR